MPNKSGSVSLFVPLHINSFSFYSHLYSRSENAVVSFIWRLKDTSENTILLTLSLLDLCMKNCENTFPNCVNKVLMDQIVYIAMGAAAAGSAAEELAKKMICDWGIKYEMKYKLPIFHDTYSNLVAKGMISSHDILAPVPCSPVRASSRSGRQSSSPFKKNDSALNSETIDEPVVNVNHLDEITNLASNNNVYLLKLERDLEVVVDKIYLSKSIRKGLYGSMNNNARVDNEEVAYDILDFLIECSARMIDIINTCSTGLLSTTILSRCIDINDQLMKEINSYEIVEDEDSNSNSPVGLILGDNI